jgi:hypothetical protein
MNQIAAASGNPLFESGLQGLGITRLPEARGERAEPILANHAAANAEGCLKASHGPDGGQGLLGMVGRRRATCVQGGEKAGHRIIGAVLTRVV